MVERESPAGRGGGRGAPTSCRRTGRGVGRVLDKHGLVLLRQEGLGLLLAGVEHLDILFGHPGRESQVAQLLLVTL